MLSNQRISPQTFLIHMYPTDHFGVQFVNSSRQKGQNSCSTKTCTWPIQGYKIKLESEADCDEVEVIIVSTQFIYRCLFGMIIIV